MPVVRTKGTDWKSLKNRNELFFRYFKWRMTVHDLDHSHYCRCMADGMSDEQRVWFAFLFGMTYRTPQAYAYWWTFPVFEDIDMDELKEWHGNNWKRTSYGTDARYNKGHFHAQVASLKKWVGDQSLLAKVRSLVFSDDSSANFKSLFNAIRDGIYKYGRMTSWITCQCLYDVMDLNIDFDNVLIESPNSDSSMQSIWNGWCYLEGRYSQLLGKQYAGASVYKVTDADLKEATSSIMTYREQAQEYASVSVDVFKWESIWCQFKRLFNPNASKEYPGHSSGDAVSRYMYYREFWPEVDLEPFRRALLSQESIVKGQTYKIGYNRVFGDTGLLLNMHEMFSDMPNAYSVLGLDPNLNLVSELFADAGLSVPNL